MKQLTDHRHPEIRRPGGPHGDRRKRATPSPDSRLAAAGSVRDQPRHHDRQRGPPDAGSRAACVELAAAVGRRRLQPAVRGAAAGRRQPQRPPRPQGIPARRPGRVRSGQHRRRPHRHRRPADRRPLLHGSRRRDDLPHHPLADLERVHRAGRARQGDRPLGRDGGHRDCARPDRRGLAARAVQLDEHLLRDGTRRRRSAPRSSRGAFRPRAIRARTGPTSRDWFSRAPRSRC